MTDPTTPPATAPDAQAAGPTTDPITRPAAEPDAQAAQAPVEAMAESPVEAVAESAAWSGEAEGQGARADPDLDLPVRPPVAPMLAKPIKAMPKQDGDLFYEPKWDGFRCIVFRDGDEVYLGSRNERPFTRYFPELVEAVKQELPDKCVVDGEIVLPRGRGSTSRRCSSASTRRRPG